MENLGVNAFSATAGMDEALEQRPTVDFGDTEVGFDTSMDFLPDAEISYQNPMENVEMTVDDAKSLMLETLRDNPAIVKSLNKRISKENLRLLQDAIESKTGVQIDVEDLVLQNDDIKDTLEMVANNILIFKNSDNLSTASMKIVVATKQDEDSVHFRTLANGDKVFGKYPAVTLDELHRVDEIGSKYMPSITKDFKTYAKSKFKVKAFYHKESVRGLRNESKKQGKEDNIEISTGVDIR